MRRGQARLAGATLLACSVVLSGCTNYSQLQFTNDKRLHFLAPKNESVQKAPVVLTWTMSDFTVAGQGQAPVSRHTGYFAIFIDRSPVKPGQSLKSLDSTDHTCRTTPACPTASFLSGIQVYTTTQDSYTLPTVNSTGGTGKFQRHAAVIVLIDTSGHRIGESSWEVDFKLPKPVF